jgi:hypothetical protein
MYLATAGRQVLIAQLSAWHDRETTTTTDILCPCVHEHATSPILQTRRRSRRLPCIDDLTPQTQVPCLLYACLSLERSTSGHLYGVL